jgi:hypothetical protein
MIYTVPGDLARVALDLFEGLSCPRSLTAAILLRYNEGDQLVSLEADPVDYLNADAFWRAKQASDFLRKCKDVSIDSDPEKAAIRGFREAEKACKATNLRLNKFLFQGPFTGQEVRIADYFDDVKRLVRSVLGPIPDLPSGKFGKGSTMGDFGNRNTLPDKLAGSPQYTPMLGWY